MIYEIGKEIRKKIEEKGMTFVAFSEKFGISDRNLQHFFKKTDITLQQITRASEILDYDFVAEYIKALKNLGKASWIVEETIDISANKPKGINITLTINSDIKTYTEKFPDLLKKINETATGLGFQLA